MSISRCVYLKRRGTNVAVLLVATACGTLSGFLLGVWLSYRLSLTVTSRPQKRSSFACIHAQKIASSWYTFGHAGEEYH